jgi:hypothetical protein
MQEWRFSSIIFILAVGRVVSFTPRPNSFHGKVLISQFGPCETESPWPESASELYRPSDRYACNRPRRPIRVMRRRDSRLTDDGEFVSLTRRPRFNSQEDSWYSFLLEVL